jgi:hypothetical protein
MKCNMSFSYGASIYELDITQEVWLFIGFAMQFEERLSNNGSGVFKEPHEGNVCGKC